MSESIPVENLNKEGRTGRTTRINKNKESLDENPNFNLNQADCETYFKSNLRGDGNAIQKEHKSHISENSNKKLYDRKKNTSCNNIFDPELQGKVSRSKSPIEENRFNANYVNGALKTNIKFDPWATNSKQSGTKIKQKGDIEKELPKPVYNMIHKHVPTVSRRVSDNYGHNIFEDYQSNVSNVSQARQDTIGKIFCSDLVRTAVLKKDSEKLGSNAKIVNTHISVAKNILPSSEEPKYIKSSKKIISGSQIIFQ